LDGVIGSTRIKKGEVVKEIRVVDKS
jgi:uncharacterized Zn ribbon protein